MDNYINRSTAQFGQWELTIRKLIKRFEQERLLGSAEAAKAILLYGLKLFEDVRAMPISDAAKFDILADMINRTVLVLDSIDELTFHRSGR